MSKRIDVREVIQEILVDWAHLESFIGHSNWMPCEATAEAHYGCGTYGCVFPTNAENIVFKATTDDSEVHLVQHVLHYKLDLPGLVQYHRISPMTRSDMFALWREEIYDMGAFDASDMIKLAIDKIGAVGGRIYTMLVFLEENQVVKLISESHQYRQWARSNAHFPYHLQRVITYQSAKKLALLLAMYEEYAFELTKLPDAADVGFSLKQLFDEGIVLCDVRQENMGMAYRDKREVLVIADPSLALFVGT